ncbi:hypothetical protein GE21DRAFT_1283772 [Neurospora crassa]|nr:hypothetical protein GE21DRAFT_1283772 [Neurospora crassa]
MGLVVNHYNSPILSAHDHSIKIDFHPQTSSHHSSYPSTTTHPHRNPKRRQILHVNPKAQKRKERATKKSDSTPRRETDAARRFTTNTDHLDLLLSCHLRLVLISSDLPPTFSSFVFPTSSLGISGSLLFKPLTQPSSHLPPSERREKKRKKGRKEEIPPLLIRESLSRSEPLLFLFFFIMDGHDDEIGNYLQKLSGHV